MINEETKKEMLERLNAFSSVYSVNYRKGNIAMYNYADGVIDGIEFILSKLGYDTKIECGEEPYRIVYKDIVPYGGKQ